MMASTSHVQLEHWTSVQAPLSEAERASVNQLADWIGSSGWAGQQFNTKAAAAEAGPVQPSDPPPSSDVGQPSRPTTASSGKAEGPTLPSTPLIDAPSYLSWYAKQQALIAASTQTGHAKALQDISLAADEADALLDHLEAARVHIAELRAGARMVEEGTEGLREDAESMVERIDHLSQLAEALALRLSYFAILPSSTSFLSSPSLSLVTTSEFSLTLDRLDVALAFLRAHPHYRDAPLYKMRFEHCVVRAGTLIRMFAVGRLKELNVKVSTRLKDWEKSRYAKGKEKEFDADSHVMMNLGDPHVSALLFDRFEEEATQLRPVLQELEKRASLHAPPAATDIERVTQRLQGKEKERIQESEPEQDADAKAMHGEENTTADTGGQDAVQDIFRAPEFAALLEECRTAYFDVRRTLLSGMIANCIARIEVMAQHPGSDRPNSEAGSATGSQAESMSPTARLVNRGMAFLTAINETETSLYGQFFGTSTDDGHSVRALHMHLRTLSAPLDDRLKPRLASEGGLAGLPAATLRSFDAWREYFVRFLG